MRVSPAGNTVNYPWINPIGGLGDTMMLSGVLKQVVEADPNRRFMLVRRTAYTGILRGHPAIAGIGFPGRNDQILKTDYWNDPLFASGAERPMRILGRMFGLESIEERFFIPDDDEPDPLLDKIPWGTRNVVVAPGSVSPRKEWRHGNWERLTRFLRDNGCFVLQVGHAGMRHIRGAYSIAGLTQPRRVFPVLRRSDLIVTVDSFLMHAAHHVQKPAIVLWGPTQPACYGYPEQLHLSPRLSCPKPDGCIIPGKAENYDRPCPIPDSHCVDTINVDTVIESHPVQQTVIAGRG